MTRDERMTRTDRGLALVGAATTKSGQLWTELVAVVMTAASRVRQEVR